MKGLPKLVTPALLLVICVCAQAFKLPINLRRSIASPQQEGKPQLRESESLSESMLMSTGFQRVLQFPEQTSENQVSDYQVQISFRNQDEISDKQSNKDNADIDLQRFYKNSVRNPPTPDQAIVFPKEAIENGNSQWKSGEESISDVAVDSRSDDKLLYHTEPGIEFDESDKNSNNTINFVQSLETLAHLVRQLLFRVPQTDTPRRVLTTEPTVQAYDTSSELNVQEQSLYSGPKLRTQNSGGDCPEGLKRNRNGQCQKPSRRLAT